MNDYIDEIELPIIESYDDKDYEVARLMLLALVNRFLNDLGTTSYPFWVEQFSSEKQANRMIMRLADWGVIDTKVDFNYSEIGIRKEYLVVRYGEDYLVKAITDTKINNCLPVFNREAPENPTSDVCKPLKITGDTNNGLRRDGFAKAGYHAFKYDTEMMLKYRDEIIKYNIKSMRKLEIKLGYSLRVPEGYDYQGINEKVFDLIVANKNEEYILGSLELDGRGRAIYESLKKMFSPISNKMARALVVSPPEKPAKHGIYSAYIFIAELYHGFEPDIAKKVRLGRTCYVNRSFHNLDLNTDHGLDNLFENIWLERLYAELDQIAINPNHKVTTPLEVDFSSSNMVMFGLLLGHHKYVDHTKYMWNVRGLSKLHVKFAQTPYVFGSSAPIKTLWLKNKLKFTNKQIEIMKKEQTVGRFAIANEFKDILVKHSHPKEVMDITIGSESFKIECNKTKNVGDTTIQYIVYDSKAQQFRTIVHTKTHIVPDLQQFRIYMSSLLAHNRDSYILDNISLGMEWILPIHDAGIVTWNGSNRMRKLAVDEMHHMDDNREQTVYNYLKSINLDTKGWVRYAKLQAKIAEENKDTYLKISPFLLK